MGWRGTLRSMGAAGRRAQQASERRTRALSKLQAKAGSFVSEIDAEVEKEIQRIEQYEEKICNHPAKTLQLWYEPSNGWTTVPFKEQTGKLTYTVKYTPPCQDVSFEPSTVEIGGIRITPRALSVSQYFTAVAFEASTGPAEGGRVLKLTFPNKPESSRIALASPIGEVFSPLDTNLDGRIFPGTNRSGVVTFEPFAEGLDYFDILFEDPAKRKGADPETLRIRVSAAAMRDDMATCLGQPSILEKMTEQFRHTQRQVHDDVKQKVKQASSGCLIIVAMWCAAVAGVAATLTWFASTAVQQ